MKIKIFYQNKIKSVKIAAVILGGLGFCLAILTPLLPIKIETATINWPQNNRITNVSSPLIGYAPLKISIQLPCQIIKYLPNYEGIILSTIPKTGRNATQLGLFIKASPNDVLIGLRNVVIATANKTAVLSSACKTINFSATAAHISAIFTGLPINEPDTNNSYPNGQYRQEINDPALIPQVTGIYTELPKHTATKDIKVQLLLDTRFESTPHVIKFIAIIIGIITTILSLICLSYIDNKTNNKSNKTEEKQLILAKNWGKNFKIVDIAVIIILLIWLFIGVNTSDDGYQYIMSKLINSSGYMPNYFRWLGVPENPVGWQYYFFALMLKINTSTLWLRLFPCALGILGWFLISRKALPKLGKNLINNKYVLWSAATSYLIIWLPYNNGTRPESLVTILMLTAWLLAETAIATQKILPLALALMVAGFSFGAAPGGLIAIMGVLICSRKLLLIYLKSIKINGLFAATLPILAAGTFILFISFADQSLANVLEASRVKFLYGPSLKWWEEVVRYYLVMIPTADGALSRKLGILLLTLFTATIFFIQLRRKTIPGIDKEILGRFTATILASLLFLTITPTKWTHHFGLFATLIGTGGAICAHLTSSTVLRSKRNRIFFTAILLITISVAFNSINAFWFVGNYGMPWGYSTPKIGNINISLIIFLCGIGFISYGAYLHLTSKSIKTRPQFISPLLILTSSIVLFELTCTAYATIKMRNSFSWGATHFKTLLGNKCGLANDILVETDPNQGFLTQAAQKKYKNLTPTKLFQGTKNIGFSKTGTPTNVTKEEMNEYLLERQIDTFGNERFARSEQKALELKQLSLKSNLILPFGLHANTTPVQGTFLFNGIANLTTHWYKLPPRNSNQPLIIVTAAGKIENQSLMFGKISGEKIILEYATIGTNDIPKNIGHINPIDIGPFPAWRNLRFPIKNLPPQANAIRIIATDTSLDDNHWIALIPPRIPELVTLNQFLGNNTPVLEDWLIAFAFPCQHPINVKHGILESPKYRISPDHEAKFAATDAWESGWAGGGLLGVTDLFLKDELMSSYLRNYWELDWGYLTKYIPLVKSTPAKLEIGSQIHSGWWNPGKMRAGKYSSTKTE